MPVSGRIGVSTLQGLSQQSAVPARWAHKLKALELLYHFWEPLNWEKVKACETHREEVKRCARLVSGGPIEFEWMTYSDVWRQWSEVPSLKRNASALKAQYEVEGRL